MSKYRSVRGMVDILSDDSPFWHHLERTVADVLASYGYGEVRLPIVEHTELFTRSIGQVTDIVEKGNVQF